MKSKRILLVITLLLLGAFGLAACNLEGVAAFAPGNNWVAVISGGKLYTTDINGGSPIKVEEGSLLTSLDVSFDLSSNKILYGANNGICLSNARATTTCTPLFPLPSGGNAGFLTFLPNGQFIYAYRPAKWVMEVRNGNGSLAFSESNIDHFFLTSDAFKVKQGSDGKEWMVTPYNKPSGQQNLRVVFARGSAIIMYNFAGSIEGPTNLGPINESVVNLLNNRDAADITSGVVSPDGTKMVFRTRAGADPNFSYGLYVVDLAAPNAQPIQLASNANFRLQFAFSPNGSELAYESNEGGRTVWIANSDGSNRRKLADNASLPDWH